MIKFWVAIIDNCTENGQRPPVIFNFSSGIKNRQSQGTAGNYLITATGKETGTKSVASVAMGGGGGGRGPSLLLQACTSLQESKVPHGKVTIYGTAFQEPLVGNKLHLSWNVIICIPTTSWRD